MCGICGFIQNTDYKYDRHKVIHSMNELMTHRGPDDEGYYEDDNISLGHKRLSIVDLKGGHQPILNQEESKVIVYNGEVYNYLELKKDLEKKGYKFKTNSDTETILHCYDAYGLSFVDKLNGMFGLAIWDSKRKELVLVRDRMGIKQVYWYFKDGVFIFASEMKPILEHPLFKKEFNLAAFDNYFTFRYVQAPLTPFKNLHKLEPGSFLTLDKNFKVKVKKYWQLDFDKEESSLSFEEHLTQFREKFEESVNKRLMSEVPVGILLSGGLDSSAVVAGLSRQGHKNLKTFSVGFKDNEEYNESYYAKMVSDHFKTDHYQIDIDYQDYISGINKFLYKSEELMSDPASIPLYYVSELATQYVTVILSGEGADELLAGYTYWMDLKGFRRHKLFRKIPSFARHYFISPLNKKILKSPKLNKYLKASANPLYKHHYFFMEDFSYGPRFSTSDKTDIFSDDVLDDVDIKSEVDYLMRGFRELQDINIIDQELGVDQMFWLPDNLLIKADKMTMAHSLELRVPFLDHTFVEYINKLPLHLKLHKENDKWETKYILRKSYEDILPSEILTRPKKGFPVPIKNILKTDLKERFLDNLRDPLVTKNSFIDLKYISNLFDDFCKSTSDSSKLETRIWSIYVLFEWLKKFGQ